LKAARFTLAELKAARFTAAELKAARFTLAELKAARFTAAELKAARFTAAELKAAKFTLAQLKTATFTAIECLLAPGVSRPDLERAGFNVDAMKAHDKAVRFEDSLIFCLHVSFYHRRRCRVCTAHLRFRSRKQISSCKRGKERNARRSFFLSGWNVTFCSNRVLFSRVHEA